MFGRKRREADLERELQAHLELEAEERLDRMSPREAQAAARRALGNAAYIKEETRESWGWMWLDRLGQDAEYALRMARTNPGLWAVAILTAALGIGANTAIFGIVDAVLLHPLPYADADRLVSPTPVGKTSVLGLGVADFQYATWRDQAPGLEGAAAYTRRQFTITGNGAAEQLTAGVVTPGFLRVLGVAPTLGRDLTAADAGLRGGTTALISHALWVGRFQSDAAILARTMTLDGKLYTIAGVLPRGFEFPENKDVSLIVAMREPPPQPGNGTYFYSVIARLKRGVTPARAQVDLGVIDQRLAGAYPKKFQGSRAGAQTRVTSLHDRLVGDVRPALVALEGAVGLVLLIVCVNVSNLLVGRSIARQREIAVRMALGAGRARVARQLLTEGLLLGLISGAAGLALAAAAIPLLRAIAPAGVPHVANAHLGGAVLAFNFAVAAGAGMLFGLAPLRGVSGIDPESALKQSGRSASGTRRHARLEGALIVAETAFALMLLAGAGLLLRTFVRLTAISPGFQPDGVAATQVALPYWKYPTVERQRAFMEGLIDRARSGPGVTLAGAAGALPYEGFLMMSRLVVEGRPAAAIEDSRDNVSLNCVAGDYFRAMGIPVLEGRALEASDAAGRPAVAVINQSAARRFFAGVSPIGARVKAEGISEWMQVVGVVGDVKQAANIASEPRMEIFQPAGQSTSGGVATSITVRSTADPRALLPWLRAEIAAMDKDLPPVEIHTMRGRMAALIQSQVFVMRLLVAFAAIAIALAAIGIYGVLVYSVERRRRELGIRLALGATNGRILGLVVGRGVRLAAAGAALGVAGSLALTRFLETLLYGVKPHDPATMAGGSLLVLAVAAGAAYLPARRATHEDTLTTLRAD